MKLSGQDAANTARLLRDSIGEAILITEGPSDSRLLRRLLGEDRIHTVVTGGKSEVLQAMLILNSDVRQGFLGVVDRDFDEISGETYEVENVLRWDHNDLEMTVLYSPAFKAVEYHMCSSDKVKAFGKLTRAPTLLEAILEQVRPLGGLRWVSQRDRLSFDFESIKLSQFIDSRTLKIDIRGVAAAALQNRTGAQRGLNELVREVDLVVMSSRPNSHLCRGHDVTLFLARGLRRCLATYGHGAPSQDVLEASLLAAFGYDDFSSTELCAGIREWEAANPGFVVLRAAN